MRRYLIRYVDDVTRIAWACSQEQAQRQARMLRHVEVDSVVVPAWALKDLETKKPGAAVAVTRGGLCLPRKEDRWTERSSGLRSKRGFGEGRCRRRGRVSQDGFVSPELDDVLGGTDLSSKKPGAAVAVTRGGLCLPRKEDNSGLAGLA